MYSKYLILIVAVMFFVSVTWTQPTDTLSGKDDSVEQLSAKNNIEEDAAFTDSFMQLHDSDKITKADLLTLQKLESQLGEISEFFRKLIGIIIEIVQKMINNKN